MPNWCDNTVHITYKNPEMMKKVIDAWNSGKFLQTMHPCPQELYDTYSGNKGATDEQKENERKEKANLEKYGFDNWYHWCLSNWGTKWDIDTLKSQNDHNTCLEECFMSAWSPPIQFYEYLAKQGYEINASYFEGGMAYCGNWSSDNGDEYYEIEECTPKWIESNIPEYICDKFGLLEFYTNDDDEVDEDDVLSQIIAE